MFVLMRYGDDTKEESKLCQTISIRFNRAELHTLIQYPQLWTSLYKAFYCIARSGQPKDNLRVLESSEGSGSVSTSAGAVDVTANYKKTTLFFCS